MAVEAHALAVRRLGSESQNKKEHKPVPQKILAKMLSLTSQWQGREQVDVLKVTKSLGRLVVSDITSTLFLCLFLA